MKNLNKPRFLISVFLLLFITTVVYLNLDASSAFFSSTQLLLSEYLGWLIIIIANGFLIFSTYLVFSRFQHIKLGGSKR